MSSRCQTIETELKMNGWTCIHTHAQLIFRPYSLQPQEKFSPSRKCETKKQRLQMSINMPDDTSAGQVIGTQLSSGEKGKNTDHKS